MARYASDEQPAADSGVPRELQSYTYEDWANEGEMPLSRREYEDRENNREMWHRIRAYQRWLDERMRWSAEHGVCIDTVMGEEHPSCNMCWMADGRLKPPSRSPYAHLLVEESDR